MTEPIVTTRALTKSFGKDKTVLRGVDLDIQPGTVTALLGANGIGKSTLLRILVGFMPPTSGEARVMGIDPSRDGPKVRRLVGYVPETLELPKWMTVGEHLRFLEPFYPSWSRTEVHRLVQELGLDLKAKVHTLSKGFRTKHRLVAALGFEPDLLLLDEPFSGLDPLVRTEVTTTVLDHLRDEGRTVVLVSHSISDIERVADTVILVDDGRVRLQGEVEELQRGFVRLDVVLKEGASRFTPPGSPRVEPHDDGMVLVYTDWEEEYDALIRGDERVHSARRLKRDLNDVFTAYVKRQEEHPCAVSAR